MGLPAQGSVNSLNRWPDEVRVVGARSHETQEEAKGRTLCANAKPIT
jgi:hypothetical protein